MKLQLPYIDRIWRVKDSIPLEADASATETFENLDPLFATYGTSYDVSGDTLTFAKKNPVSQDKLATFSRGTMRVQKSQDGTCLTYDVSSTALFLCFLAPLLFLIFAQTAVFLNTLESPLSDERGQAEKDEAAEEDKEEVKLHWIDTMLGAPAPKQPGEDDAEEDEEEEDEKHSPVRAYVLAGLFAAIYAAGRILEPWLLRKTLRATLSGEIDLTHHRNLSDPDIVGAPVATFDEAIPQQKDEPNK